MVTEGVLDVGETVSEFDAPLVYPRGEGRETESVPLSSLLEDSAVLLAFYTNDFSPDCIDEWCTFRDYSWFTADDRIQVVGVSTSGVGTHRRFIDYLDLSFPLYADTDLAIATQFGVNYRAFKLFPRARRSCFLIDQDGVVRYRWLAEHRFDPTRDIPVTSEIYEAVVEEFGRPEADTFGFPDDLRADGD